MYLGPPVHCLLVSFVFLDSLALVSCIHTYMILCISRKTKYQIKDKTHDTCHFETGLIVLLLLVPLNGIFFSLYAYARMYIYIYVCKYICMYLHIDHIDVYNAYQPGICMEDCVTFH